jgi:hypothetical protein
MPGNVQQFREPIIELSLEPSAFSKELPMSTILFVLARRAAVGLIAAPLLLGAPLPILAAGAPATVYEAHGTWQSFSSQGARGPVFGVMTKMIKGGVAVLILEGDTVTMLLKDPTWDLSAEGEVPVRVDIDGAILNGAAVVSGRNLLAMPGITGKALNKLASGAEAVIDINSGEIVWSLDLHGFTAAMSDAVKLHNASHQ